MLAILSSGSTLKVDRNELFFTRASIYIGRHWRHCGNVNCPGAEVVVSYSVKRFSQGELPFCSFA